MLNTTRLHNRAYSPETKGLHQDGLEFVTAAVGTSWGKEGRKERGILAA